MKHSDSNCCFNAQLNCHEVALRYGEIWGRWARDRELAIVFSEFSKVQKKQWHTLRVFQLSSPELQLLTEEAGLNISDSEAAARSRLEADSDHLKATQGMPPQDY